MAQALEVVGDVVEELERACEKFPGFNSAHEGFAVLMEEVDELWDHVKANTAYTEAAYNEAKQVAAMGLRFMLMIRSRQQKAASDVTVRRDHIGEFGE